VKAPLDAARDVFAGEEAWIVGGAVRDHLLGRETVDLDLAVPEDPKRAARAVADQTGGAAFRLSGAFGAWRVVGPEGAWHVDLVTLRDGDIRADLAARDFTINAMAEPLAGGELLDPHGGRADLEARRLRMVSAGALASDPLRALRAIRIAVLLELTIEPATAAAIGKEAPGLAGVAHERVFGELKQVVCAPAVRQGLALMEAHGITAQVLPELLALRGVDQNVFHHLDVHDHTLAALQAAVDLEAQPATMVGEANADGVAATRLHRIVDVNSDGTFITQGDANRDADSDPLVRSQIVGQARLLVPLIGLPSVWLTGDTTAFTVWVLASIAAVLLVAFDFHTTAPQRTDNSATPISQES